VWVQSAVVKSQSAAAPAAGRNSSRPKSAKLSAYLVTRDDSLWPQIGALIGQQLILKQSDTVDELLATTPREHPAIILWDARNQPDAAALLSRLQQHSACFAVVALGDDVANRGWQVVVNVSLPLVPQELTAALHFAHEEVRARMALLGEDAAEARAASPSVITEPAAQHSAPASGSAAPVSPAEASPGSESTTSESTASESTTSESSTSVSATVPGVAQPKRATHRRSSRIRRFPWAPVLIVIGSAIACIAIYFFTQQDTPVNPAPAPVMPVAKAPAAAKSPGADEKVDLLIESAQKAMLDRHFIEPAEGSALSLYRSVLQLDPSNGEANQGLSRLAEVLFARVRSALDDRKFDVALQALETARSIDPGDSRLAAFDQSIAALRAELGPAQIQAAINAQNFDRASQLIDEAARAKSLSTVKLAQLRDDLKLKRTEFDVANFFNLIDSRLQQDEIIEPREDSAAYYLSRAREAGASAAELQSKSQEVDTRAAQTVHGAIEQRRFADAERMLAVLRSDGVAAPILAALQRDLGAARVQTAGHDQPQALDLAVSRLAQGRVTEPDNDSALFYVNKLRASDPNNPGLSRISAAVQAQILEQARAALDAIQIGAAESLLKLAAGLGPSSVLDTLNQRLAQAKPGAGGGVPEVAESSLTRVNSIETGYPSAARRKNIEGWVELSYQVTPQGSVSQIKVLSASPPGVFDDVAARALSRLRYRPALQNGSPIAVNTRLRIAFRLSQ
jgi:TonB family protein